MLIFRSWETSLRKMPVWQAAIGMPVVDQGQKSVYADAPVLQILPTLSIATQVIEREGGEEVRIR